MRRDIIIESCLKILRDLEGSGLPEMIDVAFERARSTKEERGDLYISFDVFQKISVAFNKYSDDELHIVELLEINVLGDPVYWQSLSGRPSARQLMELRTTVNDAIRFLPRFLDIIRQDDVEAVKQKAPTLPDILKNKEAMKFILPEAQGEFSSPNRLIFLLQSISALYEVIASIDNGRGDDLIVLACDSGSDKSIDIAGFGKFMEQLRLLFLGIWDRRVFYRNVPASQSLGLIAQSLPILKEIDDLKKSGAISPEECEILKRKAIDGATKFMESGAMINEMEQNSHFAPRIIMRPETKLLAAPMPNTIEAESETQKEITGAGNSAPEISEDELALLQKLLQKAKVKAVTKEPSKKPIRRSRKP